jgi:uncharacterized protein (TIGR02118 family)
MTVKLIGLLKRKSGLTREAFIDYYENNHVPLVTRLVPLGRHYRRNYVDKMRINGREADGDFDYDVVSEVRFESDENYSAFAQAMADPKIFQQIVADEENFLERSASRILMVTEYGARRSRSGGNADS